MNIFNVKSNGKSCMFKTDMLYRWIELLSVPVCSIWAHCLRVVQLRVHAISLDPHAPSGSDWWIDDPAIAS